MKKEIAVLEPDTKAAEDRADLIEAVQRIEQWARFNDNHVRRICIDALKKAGAWEQ